jgi:hypothetical protein
VPLLWELAVTGWGGIAPESSGVMLDHSASCSECGLLIYTSFTDASRLVDEKQWDGSDIFMVWPLPKFVMVANSVAELIRAEG